MQHTAECVYVCEHERKRQHLKTHNVKNKQKESERGGKTNKKNMKVSAASHSGDVTVATLNHLYTGSAASCPEGPKARCQVQIYPTEERELRHLC